jgi:hypothetical protein
LVNAVYNAQTQIIYNGYTLTSGVYASVWGTGSCQTSFQATKIALGVPATPTPSPVPTPTPTPPANLLAHVQTAEYCCGGYNSQTPTGGVATTLPWVTYYAAPSANGDPTGTYPSYGAPGLAAAGVSNMRVYAYLDDSRVYKGDTAYPLIAPGGADASAEAKTCSGTPITISNGTGYLSDPYQPATLALYDSDVGTKYNYSSEYGLVYFDDINGWEYNDNSAVPCELGAPWAQPSISSAYATLIGAINLSQLLQGHGQPQFMLNSIGPMMIEAKGSTTGLISELSSLIASSSILGLDCESCLADTKNAEIGLHTNYELTNQWIMVEDAEIALVNAQKIFWLQDQDSNSTAGNSFTGRMYAFASFMLTWNPSYTVYQNDYYGYYGDGEHPNSQNPQIHVFPEESLVAYNPRVAYPSTSAGVGALADSGGTYFREYYSCFYAGQAVGPCAVVVNPDSSSHAWPALQGKYTHTLSIATQMDVIDGGTATMTGSQMPSPVPATTGWILLP